MITIHKESGEEAAREVASYFGTNLDIDCRHFTIPVAPDKGEGAVYMYDFEDVISAWAIDARLHKTLTLCLAGRANTLLRFNYCLAGQINHSLADVGVSAHLSSYQGSLTANKQGELQKFTIPANIHVRFVSLELDRSRFRHKLPCPEKDIPGKLLEILNDTEASGAYLYVHNYSHTIQQEIEQLIQSKYQGLVRSTQQEASALEIIAQQYRQFHEDHSPDRTKSILKEFELERILRAKAILDNEFRKPPTIPQLAKTVGINQQKLKKEFKKLTGHTINQYVQRLRLDFSRSLLMSNGYSVKEAANEVGYQNLGFFARKFKIRFGILPSEVVKIHS